jgi:hypothetical protein
MPAGVQAGELLVVIGAVDVRNSETDISIEEASTPCTPGSVFSAVSAAIEGTVDDVLLRGFYKVADGTEGGTTVDFCWTNPTATKAVFTAFRVSGVRTSAPVHAHGTDTGSSTSATSPSITTNVNQTLLIRYAGVDHNTTITSVPGTEIARFGVSGPGAQLGAGWETQATAGATGTGVFVNASDQWAAATWAIPPAVKTDGTWCAPFAGCTQDPNHTFNGTRPRIDFSTWAAGLTHAAVVEHRLQQAWSNGIQGQGRVVAMSGSSTRSCQRCQANSTPYSEGVNCDEARFSARIWANSGETPGNSTDDDANGWIDDVHGPMLVGYDPNDSDTWDTCERELTTTCGSSGTDPCAGAIALGHDREVAHMAVASGTITGDEQIIGSAPAAQIAVYGAAGSPSILERGSSTGGIQYARAHGHDVIFAPICGGGIVPCAAEDAEDGSTDADAPFLIAAVASPDTADFDWPTCSLASAQPGLLPLKDDLTGPVGNWLTTCTAGAGLPVAPSCDLAVVANDNSSNASSWMHGRAAGMFALMRQRYPTASRGEILARMVRTARKIGTAPYDKPWPRGQVLYPEADWNHNLWNDSFCGGLVNIHAALETRFPDFGDPP